MVKIEKVVLKSGEVRWRARGVSAGRHPNGRRRQVTITKRTKKAVEVEVGRITGQVQVHDGTYTPRWDGTVSQMCDDYQKSACFERSANTAVSYAGALLPARGRLGNRKARSVTRQDIEQLRDWMLAEGRRRGGQAGCGLGARSVRLTIGRLSAAFAQACQDNRLAANPCIYVRLPSQPKREDTTWSEAEANRFLTTAAADRLHAVWRLSLLGERRGEVLGERWDDFDVEAGTITVARSRVLVYSRVIEKAPKSARGARTLPLDSATIAALKSLRKRQIAERLAAGAAYVDSGYIAADELGQPLHPERYSDEFARLCREAGVAVIRLHDARHSINSLLAKRGIPPHIRALWMGHTPEVNQAVYTHASAADLAMVTSAIGEIYSAV